MDLATDPTIKSLLFSKFNPNKNPPFYDVCVRRIPLSKLDTELIEDARKGGSKLVERFAQGIWAGRGFTIQRLLENYQHKNETTKHQLWTKRDLRESTYPIGTELADHFNVVDRPNSTAILFRCGDSPLKSPDGPRPSDGLFEMSAETNFDSGFAEFRLKTIFYQGEGKAEKAPFAGEWFMPWVHRVYARIWMETGVGNCKKGMFVIE